MKNLGLFGTSLFLGLTLMLAGSSTARADTYLSECAANGVLVNANLTLTYDGVGSVLADGVTPPPANDLVVLPGIVADATVPPTILFPATGDPKDVIQASSTSRFEFGAPVGTTSLDLFEFVVAGTASAFDSRNLAGNQADAVISVKANAQFFVDPAPAGSCPGKIQLAALPSLATYETFVQVTVTENPGLFGVILASQGPGSPAMNVVVVPNNLYKIDFDYGVRVPFGVDPPFGITVPITVAEAALLPALSPAAYPLLALALAGTTLLFWHRMRVG